MALGFAKGIQKGLSSLTVGREKTVFLFAGLRIFRDKLDPIRQKR